MGFSTSKTKQQTTSNQSGTMTPTNPQWVTDSLQGFNSRIGQFGQTDPYSYVAPASQLQQQAFTAAGNIGNSLGATTIGPMQSATATQGSKYLGSYLNPYTSDVVNTTLADFDHNAAQTRAQQAAQAASNGAFSGSRYGIQEAQTEGDLARARASTEAGLRSDAFNTAAGLGMQDADRFANVGEFNAGQANQRTLAQAQLGDAAKQRQLAGLSLMGDLGSQQYAINQARAEAPLKQLQAMAQLYGSTPYNLFTGQNTTGNSSGTTTTTQPGGWGMGLLGAASNMFSFSPISLSDRRLKRDIERVGEFPDGLGIYHFRYTFDPDRTLYRGVMADEVKQLRPWAYVENFRDGYAGVNYAALKEAA